MPNIILTVIEPQILKIFRLLGGILKSSKEQDIILDDHYLHSQQHNTYTLGLTL